MYLPDLRPQISQGDIIRGVPFAVVRIDIERTDVSRSHAILLSHDCEYDKPRSPFALLARIVPLGDVEENSRDLIRNRRVHRTFFLESIGDALSESYVDLNCIERLFKADIEALSAAGNRVASLDDDARSALQRQIAIFLGHGRPA